MLKKTIVWIITSITLTTTSFSQDVVKLNKGDQAPFTGALMSESKTNELRKNDEQRKLLVKENLTLKDLRLLDAEKLDIYKNRLNTTEKELNKASTRRFFSNIGYFVLGVVITGVAAKAAIESSR